MSHSATVVDGYLVEPFAASEVEVGWSLLMRDRGCYTVRDRKFAPPRREGGDRQLKIFTDRAPFTFSGEESMTVYRVVKQVPPRIAQFLQRHRLGSLVRPDDAPGSVWDEMLRGGWLEQVPYDGVGYPLATYKVVPPNSQTNH